MSAEVTAIAIVPRGVSGAFAALIERLAAGGVTVHTVDDLGTAAEIAAKLAIGPPALLVDLLFLESGADVEDIQLAGDQIKRAAHAIPNTTPIAVTGKADAQTVIACIRAGAGDVIDISLEGTAAVRQVVLRIFQRQLARSYEATTSRTLRTMIEDLLKDLIRTERRSIDLEEKLAQFESVTGEVAGLGEQRLPALLVIEQDAAVAGQLRQKLDDHGISMLAYQNGEDALRDLDSPMGRAMLVDLAVVAAQQPGADGIEVVRGLRERIPGLPAFLVTSVDDGALAARAADLGVVGFVQKPLADVGAVVERLAQLARESLERTRGDLYLQRIKARHERVLARYRSLPREP